MQLGEVHAAQLLIERRAPAESKPVEPLEQLVLPVEIELPFTIDDLRWAGPPALQATGLAGSYRYSDAHHQLEITGVDIADGHYGARLRLQGPAPMALDATLNGRVRALLAQDRSLDVRAEASIQGQLAGPDARLAVAAELHPVDAGADPPMQAQLQATLAPWQPQPVIDAKAALQNIDLATLWPEAPATLLSGEIEAGPDATGGVRRAAVAGQRAASQRAAGSMGRVEAAGRAARRPRPIRRQHLDAAAAQRARRRRPHRRRGQLEPRAGALASQGHRARRPARRPP